MAEEDKKSLNILNQSLDQIMSDRFGRYSKYIIQGRALPDVRDGLKPVQRRIIFAMNELGLFNDKAFKKSARIVGEVIGKYHPHGDSSIYEAMVRMGQDWKMNVPLIEMHGNKGSIDDDPPAAMRYTETRLAKITRLLTNGIKKDTVNFAPNFDDSEREPVVLPALLPNLLINGAKGIASGYATEMPPHNLGEVLDAIIAKVKSPNARLETLLTYMKGPDFPTGGEIQGTDGFYQAMERGQGRIIIRSKFVLNESKTKPSIEILEIPFGVVKSKLVRDIDEKRFNKSISGIKDVRDETDRNGISVMIELTPGTDPNVIVNYLLAKTDMQVYYNYNNVGIVNNAPKVMGLIDLIDAYLNHQKEVQRKSISYDLKRDGKRLEIVEGLIKVAGIAEEVIDVIRGAEGSKAGVVKALMDNFKFTELQASAIADLKLYRLSKTDQSVYLDEQKELKEKVERSNLLLNDENEFNKELIRLLKELKKNFATPRKTIVTDEIEKIEVNMEDLIKHEDVWVGISKQGYVKRFSNRAYESNEPSTYALRDQDGVVFLEQVNTSNKLLAFTSKGRYIIIPCHLMEDVKWKDTGKHINDFAAITPDENIVSVIAVDDFNLNLNIVAATKFGKVKRTKLKSFLASRISKPLTAIKLDEKDELVGITVSNGFKQIIVISSLGKSVKYSETSISIQGTKSRGMKGISLANDVYVTNVIAADNDETIGLMSQRGGAKRIKVSEIYPSSKTTQGKDLYRRIKGNPHLVIASSIVAPETAGIFRDAENKLTIFEFKTIGMTSIDEGFSSAGPSNIVHALINSTRVLSKDSYLMNMPEEKTETEKFKDAEAAIEKASQFSLDDILKDI